VSSHEVIVQGSDRWFSARLGKVTASRIKDMMAQTKTGPSASRKNLAAQLMLERVTGQREEGYINAAMTFGIETEPLARLAYSIHTGQDIEEVGFIDHPTIARSGASPDGLVGTDGMCEIKCGNTATHVAWAIAGIVPPEHALQMQWQMACTGRKWNDFVSFDPRMPEGQQMFIRRLLRDDEQISKLEQEVVKFDAEIDALVEACSKAQWY
jgi:putative phage-type endonuclease